MQTRQPAVRFRNVSKRFKMTSSRPQTVLETLISFYKRQPDPPADQELWAVNDLSFTLLQGESLGIIGRNGSGKSTILKLVARILRPTSGEILVRGRVSALLELGAGFHPDLTGRENIYLNASVLGLNRAEIEERFDSIVEFSELASFIDVPVKHYSSGMYMRLGFSVAVHVEPDILLIDEILAVGDQAFQEKCFERIWQMKRQGTTIVLVSHHTQTVRNLCTDVLWIEYGEVRAAGQAQEVLSQYTSFYAQRKKAARSAEEGSFARWGTGEVKVTDVRLLDENGDLTTTFKTGGTATLAIDYETDRVVRQAHFAVAIHSDDGVRISGPNQHQFADGSPLPARGTVTYRINYLPLLAGTYHFTVAVHDGHSDHAFDHHEQAYEFHVVGKDAADRQGFVEVPASWEWAGHAKTAQDTSATRDEEVERAGSYN